MAETVILRLLQEVDSSLADSADYTLRDREEVINELRMILDLFRDNKLGEGSRLDYLIADVVEMAQDVLDLNLPNHEYDFYEEICYILFWLRKVSKYRLGLGETESAMRSEDAGEGDEDVLGLEEDVERLLDEAIFNESPEFQICHISGTVGSGKTTFARQIYNHADVVNQYECRAWIRVSGDLSYKEILMELIKKVAPADSDQLQIDSLLEKMDNPSLQQMLLQLLQGISYFIVFDDLPKNMTLTPILKAFPKEGTGSRLVVTSRYLFIQPTVQSGHHMNTLDSKNSWKLFLKTIFGGDEDEFPKQLEKKAREMLISKCGGLPLAIKEVGRQLAEKRRSGMVEWEKLVESIDFGSTPDSLESFYDGLDPDAKSCFLHLAFFKENTVMRTEKLTQIWALGGMVLEPWRDYTQSLVLESIIETEKTRADYGWKSCRVSAILHMLSIKKAEEEIGFEILRSNGNSRPSQNPRHRVIICSRDKFNHSMNHENKHLVSLFFQGGGYFDVSPSYWKSLELLRILDWEDFGLKILPEGIGTLTELRYLGLRNNHIQELPDSLGWLKKLEVLDLAQNFMVEVPDIIWKMVSLRHLFMSEIKCRKPLKIEALQDLQTLTYISVDNWTYEPSSLQMMTSLSKLGIEDMDGKLDVSKLLASLAELKGLEHLILKGFRFRSMPCLDDLGILDSVTMLKIEGLLPRLPNSFPPNIYYLDLVNSRVNEDPMPVLEKLPQLTHLKLRNAYTGKKMVILQQRFLKLDVLFIKELRNLRDVQVGEGAMPGLRILEIKNCPRLETLPEEIGSMTELRYFKMVTTINIAAKIRNSSLISDIDNVEINP